MRDSLVYCERSGLKVTEATFYKNNKNLFNHQNACVYLCILYSTRIVFNLFCLLYLFYLHST